MSGRDYRDFVVTHRTDTAADNLVKRAISGLGSNKYKPVDYEKLKAYTAEKMFAGNKALVKVKKIKEASKQVKEHNLIKQHKMVWQKEFLRLNSLRRKYQAELDVYFKSHQLTDLDLIVENFEDYEQMLSSIFMDFKAKTADPVWNLREDLMYWVIEMRENNRHDLELADSEQVSETLTSVKAQQSQLIERLNQEQMALEQEIQSSPVWDLVHQPEKKPQTGIPFEAIDFDCCDVELKTCVLQEFLVLDAKYHDRLDEIDDTHKNVIMNPNGGWPEKDHYHFLCIVEQYPRDLANRRQLYIDRLMRELPHWSRSKLSEHDEWVTYSKYYNERYKGIILDWHRDRRELLNKAKNIFAEANAAHKQEEFQAENRQKQQDICGALYKKVKVWRESKMELMRLEQELEEQRKNEEKQLEKERKEKEQVRRDVQRQKLRLYQEEKEKKELEEKSEMRKRLAELRALLDEQAESDRKRVEYREDLFQDKVKERKNKEEAMREADEERERRLETLREQVRVEAASDPERLMGNTEAWQSKFKQDETINIQQPLFNVNTFTSEQITSDARVRFESRLREAGLHNTEYARQIMSTMPTPSQPRRDMESTVFKNN